MNGKLKIKLPAFSARKAAAFLALMVIASTILSQASFMLNARADGEPRFNMFTPYSHTSQAGHDYYLLDGKNETDNSAWNFPVSAGPDDIISVALYYHNGVEGTTAQNTMARVVLPNGSDDNFNITGYLWSDDASNATYSNPFTQNLPIHLTEEGELEYVPGSLRWFPNNANWSSSPVSLPNGQDADDLFGGGVNIGSVIGCWEYSGTITFKLRVICEEPANEITELQMNKSVRNLTAGENSYFETTNAHEGDRVRFRINVRNTGTATLTNIILEDSLPSGLNYVSGSTCVDGSPISSNAIVNGGLNLGNFTPGETSEVIFDAIVDYAGYYNYNGYTHTITNTSCVDSDQTGEISDCASVCIYQPYYPTPYPTYYPPYPTYYPTPYPTYYPTPYPTYYPAPTPTPAVSVLHKEVNNLTAPNGSPTENMAAPGDTLHYSIVYTNTTGATLNNVQVMDVLPDYTTFLTASNNGYYNSGNDQITWNIGSLASGHGFTVYFQARVETVPYSNFIIPNIAHLQANNCPVVNSNEVTTTVIVGVVKGVSVQAVTGGNNLASTVAASLVLAMWFIIFLYLVLEYPEFWRKLDLKLAVWKIRIKETP